MRLWQRVMLFFVISFTAVPKVFASAILSWDENTEPDLAGYRAFYMTSVITGGPADTDAIAVEMGPAFPGVPDPVSVSERRTFTITGLSPGTYYFAVTAYDTAGNESGFSNVVSKNVVQDATLPGDVTNVTATPGNGMIRLQWRNPSDSDLAGVKINYRTDRFPSSNIDGTEVAKLRAVPGTIQTFDFTGLVNGQTYYFSLHAYDTSGNMRNTVFARGIPQENLPPPSPVPSNHSSNDEASTGGGCGIAMGASSSNMNDRIGTIISFFAVPFALFLTRIFTRIMREGR